MEIRPPKKIYLKDSTTHGLGVFCSEEIQYNEIIDTCPFLLFPHRRQEKLPFFQNYAFCWPKSENWVNHVLVTGYGSYYNHSEMPNVSWESDTERNVFVFKSLRKIKVGEELFIDYGNGVQF